jgi:hypothetical protein
VILPIMPLQTAVVHIILRLTPSPVTYKAALMFLPTMNIQLVIPIESLSTEAALGMAFEATLVNGSWIIVSFPHMFIQLLVRKQFMFMGKDLLMP